MNRKERITSLGSQRSRNHTTGYDTHNYIDAAGSTTLQLTRESLGALLEGKSWVIHNVLSADKERANRKTVVPRWLKKSRRGLRNRVLYTANAATDIVGTSAIVGVDIAHTLRGNLMEIPRGVQGKPHLKRSGQNVLLSALHGTKEIALKQTIQQGLIKALIMNKSRDEQLFSREGSTPGTYNATSSRYRREDTSSAISPPTTNRTASSRTQQPSNRGGRTVPMHQSGSQAQAA